MTQPRDALRDKIAEALAAKTSCPHVVVTSISQSGTCNLCAAVAVIEALELTAQEEPCALCVRHGVPARVAVCGPACHEAHTYVAPCEQAVRLAVGDESNDLKSSVHGQLTEVRRSDIDPTVALAKCIVSIAEYWRSPEMDALADAALKIAKLVGGVSNDH